MALPTHKLDDVFENIDDPENAFLLDTDVKTAFEKAKKAYREAKEAQAATPQLVGASPAQLARVSFLQSLNDSER